MAGWLEPITQPLGTAGKTIQKLMEVRDLLKYGDTFRELYADILAAQQGAMSANAREQALVEQIRDLEKEMTRFETWEAEKHRYEMRQLAPHMTVYAIKESERGSEPFHYICANCYNIGKKQFLQQTVDGHYHNTFKCNACGETLNIIKGHHGHGVRGGGGSPWAS